MRGLISEEAPGTLGVAAALRQAIPAVYQEDPLFMLLCAAFDDLMAPLVTAVDCFDAYLDPYLAPADFLPWLADLVGYQGSVRQGTSPERAQIAGAVRDHARRGTALGIREAAARAAAVPLEQVELDDPGGTQWSSVPGAASSHWTELNGSPSATVHVTAPVPSGPHKTATPKDVQKNAQKLLAAVRAAIEEAAGVHCGIAVELATVEPAAAGEAERPSRARPSGARTYGSENEP
jgi:phage tail-like protein